MTRTRGQSQDGGDQQDDAPAAPAPAQEPEPEPAPAPTGFESVQAAPAAAQPQLPRTGADAGAVLSAGSILLAGGAALRVRMREQL